MWICNAFNKSISKLSSKHRNNNQYPLASLWLLGHWHWFAGMVRLNYVRDVKQEEKKIILDWSSIFITAYKYYSLGTQRTHKPTESNCAGLWSQREARGGGKKRCHRSFRQQAAVCDSLVTMKQQWWLPNVTPEPEQSIYVSAFGFFFYRLVVM